MLRAAAGRSVLLHLPSDGPWLNPIEMLWRLFRRGGTRCALFANFEALLTATPTISSAAITEHGVACTPSPARIPAEL